jgi:hypothetical protein
VRGIIATDSVGCVRDGWGHELLVLLGDGLDVLLIVRDCGGVY